MIAKNRPSDLFTTAEAAKYLHTTPGYLRQMRMNKRGPKPVRIPALHARNVFYRKESLDIWALGVEWDGEHFNVYGQPFDVEKGHLV